MSKYRIIIFLLLAWFSTDFVLAAGENVSNSTAESLDVDIAVNAAGEIGAVWIEKISEANQRVYFSIRRGGRWTTPAVIPGQSGKNADPCIARGVSGGFVAAWHDQAINCIRFSQYNGSWTTPLTVSQVGGSLFLPAITTTSNGRIAVGWMRGNPNFFDIFVNTFRSGWSGPVNISNANYSAKYCDLNYGPSGEIYAVWQENLWINETDYFVTKINNDRGNGSWTKPETIDDLNAWTFRPVVAVNSNKDILSCFFYKQGRSYWAAYYLDGEWQDPQVISDVGTHGEHDLYFSSVCPYGSDGFLYVYRDIRYNIIYRAVRNGNIGNAVALTSSGDCYHPDIDFSSAIGAVAAWTDRSGNCDVFVSIFEPQDETPPPTPIDEIQPPLGVEANYLNIPLAAADLKTELVVNRNLFIVQYYRKITWAFDANWAVWNLALSKYRIYRKLKTADLWEFQAEVGPTVFSHVDKNGVSQEDRFDYQVRGVDSYGNEFYAYNWLRWAPNPLNAQSGIKVKGYKVYRKLSGQSADRYTLWQAVDAGTNSLQDHATEIRQQTQYDYAVSAVSTEGKESVKAEAKKFLSSTFMLHRRQPESERLK